jgi:hypothetical protein
MASLKDAQQLTEDLRNRADELHGRLTDSDIDFAAAVQLADEVGAAADRVAATFQKVNDALERHGEESDGEGESMESDLSPKAQRQRRKAEVDDSMSREELLERAEKAEITGRHQMSKDELVKALNSGDQNGS